MTPGNRNKKKQSAGHTMTKSIRIQIFHLFPFVLWQRELEDQKFEFSEIVFWTKSYMSSFLNSL